MVLRDEKSKKGDYLNGRIEKGVAKMGEIYSDWVDCRYCIYESLEDKAVCVLNYEPCERESCEMINNDWN